MSEQYIVSARKYRPDSFGTLIGQDNIARTLKNSILRGQLAHAYLFCGPRGVGKTSTARIFAKMINCSNPGPDMEPCGHCESCESFAEGRSYCIHELDAASNNGVDAIKALLDQVQIPPQVGRYSVYIIDEVHMLSQAAFNAFLKTLEEPPSYAIFILATTEKHKIIPTILSRCQTYDFNRISVPDIVRNLRGIADKEGITIDDESLHIIARKADGAMRDALTIFDQSVAFCGTDIKAADVMRNLNVLDYEYDFELVDAFLSGDYAKALLKFDEVLSKGFNAQYFVSALSSHLRDLIVSRTAGLESLLDLPESLRQRYAEQSARCSLQFLYEALNLTTQCEAAYRASLNQRLHVEFTLMKLCFIKGVPASAAAVPANPDVKSAPVSAPAVAAPAASAPAPANPEVKTAPAPVAAPAASTPAPQAAPAAAISPAPQPVEAPTPRRRSAGKGVSMTAILTEDKAEKETEQVSDKSQQLPSDEEVKNKWAELAAAFKTASPRLGSALENAELEISEAEGVKNVCFTVANDAQKGWIEQNKLRDLEGRLRKALTCSAINLSVKAAQYAAKKIIYTPEEKIHAMAESNPEVRELITDLSLNTK
jgi:DNA polymerase III subunit gamma/tau